MSDRNYEQEFTTLFETHITRNGAEKLLNWMKTTDFFRAPASTRYHGACDCGLVMHSVNVCNVLMDRFKG